MQSQNDAKGQTMVAGAAGFIGSHLTVRLLADCHTVVGIAVMA